MEGQQNLFSQIREVDSSSYPKVIGHFNVEQKYYVVLSLGMCSRTSKKLKINPFADFTGEAEGTRFEINGHSCIILETDQPCDKNDFSSPKINSNLIDFNLTESNQLTLLSDRELQIAQLVALGQSNKQIAQQLSISKWTVLTHLRRIFAKLGVDSRAAMVYQCAALMNGNQSFMQRD